MHFLFLAAQFEFMTWFPAMILYFRLRTVFTVGPNIKWDVLHALRLCTGRYSYGYSLTHGLTPLSDSDSDCSFLILFTLPERRSPGQFHCSKTTSDFPEKIDLFRC